MRRNATLSLDGFDPDVIEAAREAAQRAGVPVEVWIASVVSPDEKAPLRRKRRSSRAGLDDAARPIAGATSDPLVSSIAEMMRRLEEIDRKIAQDIVAEERPAASSEATDRSAPRVAPAVPSASNSAASEMAERLAAIEGRMTELSQQLAAPRPPGRRGRPMVTEVRDAVTEIRQRQRELDAGGQAAPAQRPSSPVISELQRETTRLRESIGGLATGRDVGALEAAMQALVSGVQKTQEPGDLAAIAAPIEMIRAQVDRLAEDVADNVHARVASDVERLAAKVDGALSGGSAGFADHDALAELFRELEEIRRLIAALAGPERIQGLAQSLQSISGQIAQLAGSDGSGMSELRPLLEEIRSGLKPGSAVGGSDSDAIIHRIDALADKVERAGINPVGDLIGRLEDLGETLRRPAAPAGDLASIHGMLHDLAEKLDRAGASPSAKGEGLDALEKQVLALADRIDTRGADPALASLERTMSDLLTQVSALREEGPTPRAALSESLDPPRDQSEITLLHAGLADLRAHQAASDLRMQNTLSGVHTALERLVTRLGAIEGEGAAQHDPFNERLLATTSLTAQRGAQSRPAIHRPAAEPHDPSRVRDEPLEPGAGRPGLAASTARATETARGAPDMNAGAEPRPTIQVKAPASAKAPSVKAAPADGDIKTSFIAAARRAAQAAQAEVAASAASGPARGKGKAASATSQPSAQGSLGQGSAGLGAEIDKRRRPLLLGLAAIVLALGALQAVRSWTPSSPSPIVESRQAPADVEQEAQAEVARKPVEVASKPTAKADPVRIDPAKTDPATPADPLTTQSLGEVAKPAAAAAEPAPTARSVVPRVGTMSGLAGDLAAVPTSLVTLRQAALDGNGAAIFELAAREADGRGLPRDLAVAAKLYEKLAVAGYAPAQHRLAAQYEKGTGVTRDLAQAKLWYGRAAEQGNARSMHNLAVIFAENPAAAGKPDYVTAAQWFRRAAEYGVRDSQYNLAVLCARGLGVKQDLIQSYVWFSAAAAQGDEDAGRKRDDVAAKLAPKDLPVARELAASFKPKTPEPAVNEPPPITADVAAVSAVTLMGAAPPSAAPASRKVGSPRV